MALHLPREHLLGIVLLASTSCLAIGCESGGDGLGPDGSGAAGQGAGSNTGGGGGFGNPPLGASGSGGSDDECHRDVFFQPVTLGEPQPFDLVIVADHSGSLAWSRDALTAGVQELLTHVRGRSVRVFLLTPTQYGASSAEARQATSTDPVVPWQDPTTGEAYAPAMTSYTAVCSDDDGIAIACPDPSSGDPFHLDGTWTFVLPEPIALLSPSLGEVEFEAQKAAVAAAILDLPSTGSPLEQPLCTLGRYIRQDPSVLPDNAVFLLITDEDDSSLPQDCVQSHETAWSFENVRTSWTECDSECESYRYNQPMKRPAVSLEYACVARTDTGDPIPGTEESGTITAGDCDGSEPAPCTEDELTTVRQVCSSGLEVESCERKCFELSYDCIVFLEEEVDACTQSFTARDILWQNLAEYCTTATQATAGDCVSIGGVNGVYEPRYVATSSTTPLVLGAGTSDLADDFRIEAEDHFGSAHYLTLGILLDPAFSCPLGPGQSYAANLTQFIDDPALVFPLCESYEPALQSVLDFASALVQTEFTLSLEEDEDVTSVTVVDAGGTLKSLDVGQFRFERSTQTLHIESGAILESDVDLRVEVTSACRPIVK